MQWSRSRAPQSSPDLNLLVILSPSESAERMFEAINGQPEDKVVELMQQHGMEFVQ